MILDHVPAGIFWKDKNSKYMGCNQFHARAMKFQSTDEIIGKSDADLHYHPDKLQVFRRDDLKVIENDSHVLRITNSMRNLDNKEVWTETNKVPIKDENGNIIGVLGLYQDITKLILLEKEIREKEEYYRIILENLSEGVLIYDSNLKIQFCNASAEKITGFTFSDLENGEHIKNKTLLLDSDDKKIDKFQLPHFITQRTGGECKNVEIGFVYPNQEKKWIRFNSVPVFEDSKLKLIILTMVDITNKKFERDRANQIQKHLESIYSNTHVSFVYLDANFNFISVNEAYAKGAGHSIDYFLGKNHFKLYPHEENEAIFRKVVETGESFTVYAKPFTFPDHPEWGTTFWDWSLIPFKDNEGVTTHLLFSLIDVTENIKNQLKLQETELLYTNLFSVVSDSIVVLDKNGNVIIGNPNGAKLLNNVKNYIRFTGKSPFVDENLVSIGKKNLPSIKTLNTGIPYNDIVIGIPKSEREYQWLLVNTQPIFSKDTKEVIQVVVSAIDITEKRKIEKQLFTKKKMEAIGNTASSIVHDFNNILQPINLFSDLIKITLSKMDESDNVRKVNDFINKIQAATMRGKNMVTQILKVAQKKSEPTLKINLVKIIKETIGELELAKPNHIKISFITKLEQAALDATEANIHQVIYNLCNNAIYAMKNNEIGNLSINLDKIPILDEMKQIIHSPGFQFSYQIIVSDDGAGIKQTDLDKIFEPFFTTKQDKGGTGLGLASVYSIIQNLQGTISVVSKEKIGTKFTINLPCN
ncbi:MAG: PAS domain S-box protein [Leptospiraceae bacterium]|nr:PAS domain S-box protein [Leptospiraceae bacterium]